MEFLIFAAGAFVAGFIVLFNAKGAARLAGFGLLLLSVGFLLASMLRPVETGTVQIVKIFGKVQPEPIEQGLNFVVPWAQTLPMSIKQRQLTFSSNEGGSGSESATNVSPSLDGVPLEVDLMMAYKLNPAAATKIYSLWGSDRHYRTNMVSAARSAVRDEVAKRNWQEAALQNREELAEAIRLSFADKVTRNLMALKTSDGSPHFTSEQAASAFDFPIVQLRKVLPPQRVLNSISEKVAAEEDLKRQRTLTLIAEEEAKRRANEGLGVKKLFDELPSDFEPREIATVLAALADKQRADAMMKAVEAGEVNVIITETGGTPAVKIQ